MESKLIIAPLQQWLLNQGRCVSCGRDLLKSGKQKVNGVVKITCECRRVFTYNPQEGSYRRALFSELYKSGKNERYYD